MPSHTAPRTVLEECVARALKADGGKPTSLLDTLKATRHGARVCEVLMEWAIASYEVGRDVATIAQFADFWGKDERTAGRRRTEARALFSDEDFRAVVSTLNAHIVSVGRRAHKDLTSVPVAV